MKLYTEEQVKMAIQMGDKYHYLLETEEDGILKSLNPIELPSDEEVEQEMKNEYPLTGKEYFELRYGKE